MVSREHILAAYDLTSYEKDVIAAKAKLEEAANDVHEAETIYRQKVEDYFGNIGPPVFYAFSSETCQNKFINYHVYVKNKCIFCGFNKYPHDDDDPADITGNDGLDPVGG